VGTKDGNYLVRSGYHLAKENSIMVEGETSNSFQLSHLWRAVWSFWGQRAVKIFLWRAYSDILPTKKNLFKCGIVEDKLCSIYGIETETLEHAIWTCMIASDVWVENNKPFHKCPRDEEDFLGVFEKMQQRLSEEDLQWFLFIARQIWFKRNSVVLVEISSFLPKSIK
jgi:hypothetical protein